MTKTINQSYGILCAICAAAAAVADALFYGHPWGVNAAIFGLVTILAVVLRSPALWKDWLGRIWVGLALLSLLALVEEPSPLAVLMAIVSVGTLVLSMQRNMGKDVWAWVGRWFHLAGTLFLRWFFDNVLVARWCARIRALEGG